MSARDEILAWVRRALADVPPDKTRSIPHAGVPGQGVDDLVELFTERVADYRAGVRRCSSDSAAPAIAGLIPAAARLVVPDGFPTELVPNTAAIVTDDRAAPLTAEALDQVDVVITTCVVGIATTGTVVPRSRPRSPGAQPGPRRPHLCHPGRPDRRRRPRCSRPARPLAGLDLDLRTERDQRHRAQPGRGRARSANPARRRHRTLSHAGQFAAMPAASGASPNRSARGDAVMYFRRA